MVGRECQETPGYVSYWSANTHSAEIYDTRCNTHHNIATWEVLHDEVEELIVLWGIMCYFQSEKGVGMTHTQPTPCTCVHLLLPLAAAAAAIIAWCAHQTVRPQTHHWCFSQHSCAKMTHVGRLLTHLEAVIELDNVWVVHLCQHVALSADMFHLAPPQHLTLQDSHHSRQAGGWVLHVVLVLHMILQVAFTGRWGTET